MFNEEVTREEKRLATIFLILDILHVIVAMVIICAMSCWVFDLLVNKHEIVHSLIAFVCVSILLRIKTRKETN